MLLIDDMSTRATNNGVSCWPSPSTTPTVDLVSCPRPQYARKRRIGVWGTRLRLTMCSCIRCSHTAAATAVRALQSFTFVVWQSIVKLRKKATVDDVDNAINVVSNAGTFICQTRAKGSCSDTATVPLSPYASGAFLCRQRLVFSILHCRDITVRMLMAEQVAKPYSGHRTCTALAYRFFKTPVICQ